MALDISRASVGYNANQMKKTLNHIESNCVLAAKKSLRSNIQGLRTEVHKCWVGKSADNFMANMQSDVDKICKGLDQAYAGLEAEFKKVLAGLAQIDQGLIERR